MNTHDAFGQYDAQLNLDPKERVRAQDFHRELTEALRADGLISSTFLQGSFARKTMLKPLRDIDKVVILHEDYADLRMRPTGAQTAANLFADSLARRYPQAQIGRCRHAIQLDLGADTFSFDLVPAFESADESDDVDIMDLGTDGRGSSWERSNTRRLIDVVSQRNQLCGGRFVHQVRFVKHWVRSVLDDAIPGLHVESLAYLCVDEQLDDDVAVEKILACGARLLGPVFDYTDPTGVDLLSRKLDPVTRQLACRAFADAFGVANRAVLLAQRGEFEQANALWYSIFGDPFPRVGEAEKSYLRSLAAGVPVIGGNSVASKATRSTRAWRPM